MGKQKPSKFDNLPEDAYIYPYEVYFSAKVRGKNGDAATPEEMAFNIAEGSVKGNALQMKYPRWKVFIPHDHEELVDALVAVGVANSESIMQGFCKIVSTKEILVVVAEDAEVSGGVQLEIKQARKRKMPILSYTQVMGLS